MPVTDRLAEAINDQVPFSEWPDDLRHSMMAVLLPVYDPVPEKGSFPDDMRKSFNLLRRLIAHAGPANLPEEFKTQNLAVIDMRNADDVVDARTNLIYKIKSPWTFVF